MLVKFQKHRFSADYNILENVRNVSYSDSPHIIYDEKTLLQHMNAFMNAPHQGKRIVWYCLDNKSHPDDGEVDFKQGYAINRITFVDEVGEDVEMLFDGEAFVCNDDGKTIQRIKRGGCDRLPPKKPN